MVQTSSTRLASVACLLASFLWAAPGVAAGQRLFARLDDGFVELGSSRGNLGRVVGYGMFPACGPARGYAPQTWPVLYGRYLAWERDSGICLLDTQSGNVRSMDVPEFTSIVAASMDTFGLVLALGSRVSLLADPSAALTSFDLDFSGLEGHVEPEYFIVSATRKVVVILGSPAVPATEEVRITAASLDSGTVERRVSMTPPSPMGRFAVNRQGTRIAALRAWRSSPWEDWIGDAVSVLDLATGALRTATGIRTMRLTTSHLLEFSDDGTEIRIATPSGIARLDAATLARTGQLDVPRVRVPATPGWSRQVGGETFEDPAPGTLYVLEEEWHDYSYSQHDLRRITLSLVEVSSNSTVASLELLPAYGLAAYHASYFFVPPPPSPQDVVFTTAPLPSGGAAATGTWSPVPGATHYVVEAGSAPGLADRLTLNVSSPGVTFSGAPPGTYYVRVRAVGIGGQGPRSTDLIVTVP